MFPVVVFVFSQQNRKFVIYFDKNRKLIKYEEKEEDERLIDRLKCDTGSEVFQAFSLDFSFHFTSSGDVMCKPLKMFIVVICALNLTIKHSYQQQGGQSCIKIFKNKFKQSGQ